MNDEKEYFDTTVPEKYIIHLRDIDTPIEKEIIDLFCGDQSQDYYLGMIAGIRGYISILNNIPFSESEMDGFLHISIDMQKCIVQFIK